MIAEHISRQPQPTKKLQNKVFLFIIHKTKTCNFLFIEFIKKCKKESYFLNNNLHIQNIQIRQFMKGGSKGASKMMMRSTSLTSFEGDLNMMTQKIVLESNPCIF